MFTQPGTCIVYNELIRPRSGQLLSCHLASSSDFCVGNTGYVCVFVHLCVGVCVGLGTRLCVWMHVCVCACVLMGSQ